MNKLKNYQQTFLSNRTMYSFSLPGIVEVPVAYMLTNNLNCEGLLHDPDTTILSIDGKGKLRDTNAFIENKLARKSRFVSVMQFSIDQEHKEKYEQLREELEGR